MTAKGLYESLLVELNKVDAPSLLLEDYNYFINKAVNLYINKAYNKYDVTQQTTDDLRVLKSSAILKAKPVTGTYDAPINELGGEIDFFANGELFGATYEVCLPDDYLHMLNCLCIFKVNQPYKCYPVGKTWAHPATKLTADAWATVYNNAYMRPSYRRPYYYIHNVNLLTDLPTNEYNTEKPGSTDQVAYFEKEPPMLLELIADNITRKVTLKWDKSNNSYRVSNPRTEEEDIFVGKPSSFEVNTPVNLYWVIKDEIITTTPSNEDSKQYKIESVVYGGKEQLKESSEFPRTIPLKTIINNKESKNEEINTVDKTTYSRYANPSKVRCEIRYGKDSEVFELLGVIVDYIKAPLHIKLTQEQIDRTIDRSQVLEFPDYVCQEIINELVLLVMENASDLRIRTQPVVSQSIANPTQPLTAASAKQLTA